MAALIDLTRLRSYACNSYSLRRKLAFVEAARAQTRQSLYARLHTSLTKTNAVHTDVFSSMSSSEEIGKLLLPRKHGVSR